MVEHCEAGWSVSWEPMVWFAASRWRAVAFIGLGV